MLKKKFLGIVILHKKAKVCTVDFNIAPFAPFAPSFLRMHAYIIYIIIYKRNKKDNYIHNSLSYKEKFSCSRGGHSIFYVVCVVN